MPDTVLVAIVTAGAALMGYLLQPLGRYVAGALEDRRMRSTRRRQAAQNVVDIGAELVDRARWAAQKSPGSGGDTHQLAMRLAAATPSVSDDELRRHATAMRQAAEALVEEQGKESVGARLAEVRNAYEAMVSRAGEVIRD